MPRSPLAANLAAAVVATLAAAPAAWATPKVHHGLTVDDMLAFQQLGAPAVSPDGRQVAFTVRTADLAANRGRTDVWLVGTDGGPAAAARQLTTDPANDSEPAWAPDGRAIYFLSRRGGTSQVWWLPLAGGEASQVTNLPIDVTGFRVFPDGKHLLLSAEVWPEAKTLADSAARDAAKAKEPLHAQAYDHLMFRHWDTWEDGRYAHLFVWTAPAAGGRSDDARDLTAGLATDAPTRPFGGMDETAISPDGKLVAYVARVGGRAAAWTTNTDVYLIAADGKSPAIDLTAANLAYDNAPRFSPDGKTLAALAMARPGYEADRNRVVLFDVASRQRRVLTEAWDRSPDGLAWTRDGAQLLATADHQGAKALFAIDAASGAVRPLVISGAVEAPAAAAGGQVVYLHDTFASPAELWTVGIDGASAARPLTHLNDARVADLAWGSYAPYAFTGAHGDSVSGYVMKPANFVAGTRYPVALLIHGGPQHSFDDHFHYRWNPEVFAGHGWGVVIIDFHGSSGYGQAFTDAINHDWGGAPFDDLMAGLDAALAANPWLDGGHAVALGASYGGYMINWINGKTHRFKALVCHDGNLDERMAYFDTEELWFPEWEHGGTPWEHPEGYAKHNPIDLVSAWQTPTLVIHGGRDYRVVDTQGMSTFTALQRKGIASRLLYFPEENHWVLQPLASKRWHEEVLSWIDAHGRK
jgi:dipeptidyl aminopeptidase/acylaminoacyl peptidase